MQQKAKHCCEIMSYFIADNNAPIDYGPVFREYGFLVGYKPNNKKWGSPEFQLIYYCPWCATKLPLSLRGKFFDLLEQEYNIYDNAFEIFNNKNLPEEFKSDLWWKLRNL